MATATTYQPLPPDVAWLINGAAQRHQVDPFLARAVAWIESRGRQTAISNKGARGVMQLMPATAKSLKVNPDVLAQNIEGGVRLLAENLRMFGGNEEAALAAYNGGPRLARNPRPYPAQVETYIARVLARRRLEQDALARQPTQPVPEGRRQAARPLPEPTPAAPAPAPSGSSSQSSQCSCHSPTEGGYDDDVS